MVDTGLGGENGGGERKPERRAYGGLGRRVDVDVDVDVDVWADADDLDEVDNEETVGVGLVDAGTEQVVEEGRCPYRIFSHRLFEADNWVWRIWWA